VCLRFARKRIFIYGRKKITAFPSPIFMKTTNAEQHYVRISDTEFYPDRTINVGNKGRSAFTYQVKQAFTAPGFTKLTLLSGTAQRTVLLRFVEVRQERCRAALYSIVALYSIAALYGISALSLS